MASKHTITKGEDAVIPVSLDGIDYYEDLSTLDEIFVRVAAQDGTVVDMTLTDTEIVDIDPIRRSFNVKMSDAKTSLMKKQNDMMVELIFDKGVHPTGERKIVQLGKFLSVVDPTFTAPV